MNNTPLLTAPRRSWFAALALALFALGFGVFCFLYEHEHGTIVTGLRTPGSGGASWGLYIVFVVYFIGVSFAGITVAALARLFNLKALEPVTRMAELLTLVSLVAGASCVIADLGRPLAGLLILPQFARPSSPFFGTFTLVVSGYLFSSLVYFFLSGRRDAAAMAKASNGPLKLFYLLWASGYEDTPAQRQRHRNTSFILSLSILPLLVVAHSTLGLVFGIQGGRPGWFSTLQAPAFVLLAGVSGTGMLILLALAVRWLFRAEEKVPNNTLKWLGNALWILSIAYLYLMIVEEVTATYASPAADRHIAHEIVAGAFAPYFWTTVGGLLISFLVPFSLFLRKQVSPAGFALAAVCANVAAICKRMLIVVPSQTHGGLMMVEQGQYTPTWVEYGLVFGLFGLCLTVILLFARAFPLVPQPHAHDEKTLLVGEVGRRALTGGTIMGSLCLMAIGLSDSFRLWSGDELDPRIPFAPVIFASGVMLLFFSSVVYELLPEPERRAPEPNLGAQQATASASAKR